MHSLQDGYLERSSSELSDYFEVIEIPMGTMSSVSAQAVQLLLSLRMSDEISAWSLHQELLETRLPLFMAISLASRKAMACRPVRSIARSEVRLRRR